MELPDGLSPEAMAALALHFAAAEDLPTAQDAHHEEPAAHDFAPEENLQYSEKEYWEERFADEEHKEWLGSFQELEPVLTPVLQSAVDSPRILLVGCGNSSLGPDLCDAGWSAITSTDYSSTVIAAMSSKYSQTHPGVKWQEVDMTDMSGVADDSFDVVIDKAAMDALMAAEGSPWQPAASVVQQADQTCLEMRRVLATGGIFIQISFAQPHFRTKYLLRSAVVGESHRQGAPYGWSLETVNVDVGLGYFMYVMRM